MFHVFSDKRSQQFKEQLYRAQRKQESKQKESKRKMNDRERQQCLEDIETIKRLSAEKEALLIQKSLNQVKMTSTSYVACFVWNIYTLLHELIDSFRVEDPTGRIHLAAQLYLLSIRYKKPKFMRLNRKPSLMQVLLLLSAWKI